MAQHTDRKEQGHISFWGQIKAALIRFMSGRNGMDNLGLAARWGGLILSLLDTFLVTGLLSLLGLALFIYAVFRLFSRNTAKRAEENRRYVAAVAGTKTKVRQFFLRIKNSRKYKYFKCPQCKVLIRLERGCGQKHRCCPKCHHEFDQKA